MPKSGVEPKAVVGEDGELLEADISFPAVGYVDPYDVESEPSLARQVAQWVIYPVILLSVCGMFWLASNLKPQSNNSDLAVATQFANHPIHTYTQIQLPTAQSASEWNSGLTNIRSLSWSHDQHYLAIGYGSQQVAILDLQTSQYIAKQTQISAFEWSHTDAKLLVEADNQTIGIYQNDGALQLHTRLKATTNFSMPASLVRWSADGAQIAALSQDRKTIDIVDAGNGELITEKEFQQPVLDISWSTAKALLLAVQANRLVYFEPAKAAQQEQIVSSESNISWRKASFAPDGTQLAAAGNDCDARLTVFDHFESAPTWTKRVADYATQNCSSASQAEIAWSPLSNQIATYMRSDDAVYLWDSQSAAIIDRLLPLRTIAITCMAWSPDGHYLTIALNGVLVLWSP